MQGLLGKDVKSIIGFCLISPIELSWLSNSYPEDVEYILSDIIPSYQKSSKVSTNNES